MNRRVWLGIGCGGLVVVAVAAVAAVFYLTWQSIQAGQSMGEWSYTDLKQNADAGRVSTLYIRDGQGEAVTRDGRRYAVGLPHDTAALARELEAEDPPVRVVYEGSPSNYWLAILLPNLLLLFLLLAFATVVGGAVFLAVYLTRGGR